MGDHLASLPLDPAYELKGQAALLCLDSLHVVNVADAPVLCFPHIKTGSEGCLWSQFWIPTLGRVPD